MLTSTGGKGGKEFRQEKVQQALADINGGTHRFITDDKLTDKPTRRPTAFHHPTRRPGGAGGIDSQIDAAKLRVQKEQAEKYNELFNDQKNKKHLATPFGKIASSKTTEILSAVAILITLAILSSFIGCKGANAACADKEEEENCACPNSVTQALRYSFLVTIPVAIVTWFLRLYVDRGMALQRSVFWADCIITWVFGVCFGVLGIINQDLEWLWSFNVFRIVIFVNIVKNISKKSFFKEVWLIMRGFRSSFRTLVCSAILLGITLYCFSVVGTGIIGHVSRTGFTDKEAFLRAEQFNSLFSSMMILGRFLLHDDANEIVIALAVDLPFIYVFYFLFVATTTLVVMNLIVGVIVDKAIQISSIDEEMVATKVLSERTKLMGQLADIFSLLDTDGSGTVTFEEFIHSFRIKEMRFMLQSLDFEEKDLIELFQTLNDENSGALNLEEFIFGMSRLQGAPRPKDFLALMKLSEACSDLAKYISLKLTGKTTSREIDGQGTLEADMSRRVDTLRSRVVALTHVVKHMINAMQTTKAVRQGNRSFHPVAPTPRIVKSSEKNDTDSSGKINSNNSKDTGSSSTSRSVPGYFLGKSKSFGAQSSPFIRSSSASAYPRYNTAKSKGSDESPSGRIGRKSKSASAIEGRYNLFAESTLSFGSESRGRELWKSKSDGSGEGKYRLHRGGTGSESTVSSLFPTAGQPIRNEKGRSRSNKGGKKRKSTTRFMDVGEKSSTERSLNPGKGGRTERSASMAASRRTERSLNPGKGGRTERSASTASKRPTNGSQEKKGKGKGKRK